MFLSIASPTLDTNLLVDITKTHMSIVYSQNIFFHHLILSASSTERLLQQSNEKFEISSHKFVFTGLAWFIESARPVNLHDMTLKSFNDFHLTQFVGSLREANVDVISISIEHDSLEKKIMINPESETKSSMNIAKVYAIAVFAALLTVVVGIMIYRREGSIDAHYDEDEFSFNNNLEFQIVEPSSLNNGTNSTGFPDMRSEEQMQDLRYESFSDDMEESSESSISYHEENIFESKIYDVQNALPPYPVENQVRNKRRRSRHKHKKKGERIRTKEPKHEFEYYLNEIDNVATNAGQSQNEVPTGKLIEFPIYPGSRIESRGFHEQQDQSYNLGLTPDCVTPYQSNANPCNTNAQQFSSNDIMSSNYFETTDLINSTQDALLNERSSSGTDSEKGYMFL